MSYWIEMIKSLAEDNMPLAIVFVAIMIACFSIVVVGLMYFLFYHTAYFVLIIGGTAILLYASYAIIKIVRML